MKQARRNLSTDPHRPRFLAHVADRTGRRFAASVLGALACVGCGAEAAPTETAVGTAAPALAPTPVTEALDRDLPFAYLPEENVLASGSALELPDGGASIGELVANAAGSAFDPRDMEAIDPEALGYRATWHVERYPFYDLDWDITGLRLESLNPAANGSPWLIIINGGSVNFYDYLMAPIDRPGWAQYLAQASNVMIVTIPGNFRYGGWTEPPAVRKPAYLLDQELPDDETRVRNAIFTNRLILEGLRRLIVNHTEGEILIVGHSTSGELAFLAQEEPELRERLNGRFLGWGSGGPARIQGIRRHKNPGHTNYRQGAFSTSEYPPVADLTIRSAEGFVAADYVGPLNPYVEDDGDYHAAARRWYETEYIQHPWFKQPLQNLEHGALIEHKGRVEHEIQQVLAETGNPWGVDLEDVSEDLFSTHFARMDGFRDMVWVVANYDRNHWVPEEPEASWELFIADEFRDRLPDARIKILVLDLLMTHVGNLELPQELAGVFVDTVHWMTELTG